MRLGLRPHRHRQRGRIVAEAKVGRDPQIEDNSDRLGVHGAVGSRRPNEITAAIEQADRAGRKALERNILQPGRPITAIGRRQPDARHRGRRRR